MAKDILLRDFKDIIEERKKNNDAVSFMTRFWKPQPAYIVQKYLNPTDLKTLTYQSKRLHKILDELSVVLNRNKCDIEREVIDMLKEIGLDRKMFVVRSLGIFTTKVLCKLCTCVFVNERQFFTVKSSLGNNPVVFVPTHRSYADFILMTYLCFYFDIELPAVAAGMDFHSMFAMGRIMRDTCAFYIRRTFATDKLYSAVFRQYVRTLVTNYHAPLSFFIEGTRSRSGKSLAPKYGFMSMVLEPFFMSEVPDVTFIPVSISYDKVMEERLFSFELLGVPKPKESTSGLLKALSILNENYGNVFVNLGTPISAKEYFNSSLNRTIHAIKPVNEQTLTTEENELIQKLSHEIVFRQQSIIILTTFQLVTVICSMSLHDLTALSLDSVCQKVVWLKNILKQLDANVFDYSAENIKAEVVESISAHKNLICFDSNNMMRVLNSSPFLLTDEIKSKMKGHQLCEKTMFSVIPFIMLQLYVNPVLFWLIPPSIIYLIGSLKTMNEDELWEKYQHLRILFKNEFPINNTTLQTEFKKSLAFLINEGIFKVIGRNIKVTHEESEEKKLFHIMLWPYLDCLYTLSQILSKDEQNFEEKILIKAVQETVESRLLNEADIHPYSLSLDTIHNCIQGFVGNRSLRKERRENATFYCVNQSELSKTSSFIKEMRLTINIKFCFQNPLVVNHSESHCQEEILAILNSHL